MRNAVMRKVELGDRQLRHSSRDYSAQLRPRFCPPFKRTQLSNRSQRQLYQAAQYRQGPRQTNAGTDPRPIVTLMSDLVRRINPAQESACVNPTHRSPWSVPQKHQTVDRPPRQNRPWRSQWPPAWGADSTAPCRPDYPPQGILVGVSHRLLVFQCRPQPLGKSRIGMHEVPLFISRKQLMGNSLRKSVSNPYSASIAASTTLRTSVSASEHMLSG